jgi:hypothetical protein
LPPADLPELPRWSVSPPLNFLVSYPFFNQAIYRFNPKYHIKLKTPQNEKDNYFSGNRHGRCYRIHFLRFFKRRLRDEPGIRWIWSQHEPLNGLLRDPWTVIPEHQLNPTLFPNFFVRLSFYDNLFLLKAL